MRVPRRGRRDLRKLVTSCNSPGEERKKEQNNKTGTQKEVWGRNISMREGGRKRYVIILGLTEDG